MNNRFAVINFSPNLNIRRRTIKLRQLKAMFTFTTLRLHLHTIEYRMPLRGEFRLEIFQFPYWLSNPKFRPPALSFGAQKKFRSESLTVNVPALWPSHTKYIWRKSGPIIPPSILRSGNLPAINLLLFLVDKGKSLL